MAKKYELGRGIKKGLIVFGAVAVGMAGAVQVLGGLGDPGTVTAIGGASAIAAGIRIGMNWWKVNRSLADKMFNR